MPQFTLGVCWFLLLNLTLVAAEPVIEDRLFVARHDSTEQRYVKIEPPEFDRSRPFDVLIALHGHGSDRWQFAKDPRDECRAARDVAAEHQLLFISPDYRAKTSWMGPAAEADMVQLIELLKQEYPIRKVFLCGGSMGGTGALTFAALHPELINGVAAMNGSANLLEYENFQDAIRASYGGSKVSIPEEYKKRSAEYWPERLTMPVGLTTGGQDTLVPPESVGRLARVLKQLERPVLLIHREGGGHETNYADATACLLYCLTHQEETASSRESQ